MCGFVNVYYDTQLKYFLSAHNKRTCACRGNLRTLQWRSEILTESWWNYVYFCMHAQLCLTLTPWAIAWQAPHPWNFPGKNSEWVVFSFLQGFLPTHVSCAFCIDRQILYHWATWEACLFLGDIYLSWPHYLLLLLSSISLSTRACHTCSPAVT